MFTSNLFGAVDNIEDEDISPDANDPELAASVGEKPRDLPASTNNNNLSLWQRIVASTTDGESHQETLLYRIFHTDILTLLSMKSLWEESGKQRRKQPVPLTKEQIKAATCNPGLDSNEETGLRDQRKISLEGWLSLLMSSF